MAADISPSPKDSHDAIKQDLLPLLEQTMQCVGALLNVQHGSLALYENAEGKTLITLAALETYGEPLRRSRFAQGEGVAGWVAEHVETLLINDVSLDPRFKRLGERPIGSLLCVPLLSHATCLGTLTISSPQMDAFDGTHKHQLTLFAQQAAEAIARAQQIQVLQERVRTALQAQARFLSLMTHELRSPLNAINGYLELLLSGVGGELNGQQHEFAQRARAGSEHLYALLENLFFISRVDAGQLRLSRELITLPEVIASAVEELELSAADQGIVVTLDYPSTLPRLYADALRIRQVLRNLLHNALHFTPPGGQVSLSAVVEQTPIKDEQDEEGSAYIKLQVRDSGIGIDPAFHAQIFERFFQVPTAQSERTGGQGLGLTVAQTIVALHGGHMEVESARGQGSTFTCFLPCLHS